ncbi:MAG TPA: hypothetical protein VH480_06555 [Streptosporangiaceae bacterium]
MTATAGRYRPVTWSATAASRRRSPATRVSACRPVPVCWPMVRIVVSTSSRVRCAAGRQ